MSDPKPGDVVVRYDHGVPQSVCFWECGMGTADPTGISEYVVIATADSLARGTYTHELRHLAQSIATSWNQDCRFGLRDSLGSVAISLLSSALDKCLDDASERACRQCRKINEEYDGLSLPCRNCWIHASILAKEGV